MTGKMIRVVRVLGNPKKARKISRKKKRKVKRPRRTAPHSAARRGKFLVQGLRRGSLRYLSRSGGSFAHRSKAKRFDTIGTAEAAMRQERAKAEGQGFSWLQVVAA